MNVEKKKTIQSILKTIIICFLYHLYHLCVIHSVYVEKMTNIKYVFICLSQGERLVSRGLFDGKMGEDCNQQTNMNPDL